MCFFMAFILDDSRLVMLAERLMKQLDIEEDVLIGWLKSHYEYYKEALDVATYYYQEDELVHCLVQLSKSIEPVILHLIEQGRSIQPMIINALVDEAIEQAAMTLYEELVMVFADEGYLSQRHSFDGLDSELIEAIAKKMMIMHPSIEDFYEGALLYTYELLDSLPLLEDTKGTTTHSCGSNDDSECGSNCPHCPKYKSKNKGDENETEVRKNVYDVIS